MVLTESYMYFIQKKTTKNTTEQHIFKKLPIHFFYIITNVNLSLFVFLIGDGGEYIVLTFCDLSYAALSKLTNLEKHKFFFFRFSSPQHTNMPNLKKINCHTYVFDTCKLNILLLSPR